MMPRRSVLGPWLACLTVWLAYYLLPTRTLDWGPGGLLYRWFGGLVPRRDWYGPTGCTGQPMGGQALWIPEYWFRLAENMTLFCSLAMLVLLVVTVLDAGRDPGSRRSAVSDSASVLATSLYMADALRMWTGRAPGKVSPADARRHCREASSFNSKR